MSSFSSTRTLASPASASGEVITIHTRNLEFFSIIHVENIMFDFHRVFINKQ
jgi:hypothetical protein